MKTRIKELLAPARTHRAEQVEILALMLSEHWASTDETTQKLVREADEDLADFLDAFAELHPKLDTDDANVRDMRRGR